MKRVSYRVLQTICLLLLTFALTPASQASPGTGAKPTVDLRQSPSGGTSPVEVSVGLYITNFVAIDETRETFEVGGFLTGQWHDPRLVSQEGVQQAPRTFSLEELWVPAIEGANVVSHKTNQYSLEADGNGTVTYRERFDAVYSNDFELRKFPFDTQVLRFEYEPFLSAGRQIRFAPQALRFTGMSSEQHTELAAWHIENLRYTTDKVSRDPFQPDSRPAVFQLTATRRSAFYVWKIFLPLIMITLIPVVAFWIDVKEFDWILKIPMTMLLSMVAFQFTITRDLPRIGYVTFLDAVFLASFVFCFLGVFEITLVYLLQKHGRRSLAVRLHSAGKWAYPLGYLGVLSILAIGFLA
jgi:Neurotransmitter-gated ion-channel ligand binding domain